MIRPIRFIENAVFHYLFFCLAFGVWDTFMVRMELRSCSKCRHWVRGENTAVGECRAFPPAPGPTDNWPITGEAAWCGKFNAGIVHYGYARKVTDEAILKLVASFCMEFKDTETHATKHVVPRRSVIVNELKEMGLTATPALKRIDRLVRFGFLRCGLHPYASDHKIPPVGIHVWMGDEGGETKADVTQEFRKQFTDIVAPSASSPETAMSLRGLHRLTESVTKISLATLARRVSDMVRVGIMGRCEKGFYVNAGAAAGDEPAPEPVQELE